MSNKFRTSLLICCLPLSMALLSACSDGGGGAGDTNNPDIDNSASQAVAPLVGTWDLPDEWNGEVNDEAYFVVRTPESNGVATAIIYDLDDTVPGAERNCFIVYGLPGTVSQSLSNELFLEISEYPTAIVRITAAGNLEIAVFADGASSSSPPERTLTATRIGVAEADIQLCDS